MASLNKIYLLGNVTRTPEMRRLPSGVAYTGFGLAVNHRYATAQGDEREEVCFVEIEVWGKQAEPCQNFLGKGAPVLIEGRLHYDQWDDKETGKKRSRLLVRAERVQFLGQPGRAKGHTEAPASAGVAPVTHEEGPQPVAPPPVQKDAAQKDAPTMPKFEPVPDQPDDDIPF